MRYKLAKTVSERKMNNDDYLLIPINYSEHLEEQEMYALNDIGMRIFSLAKKKKELGFDLSECISVICDEFDVKPNATVKDDINVFLGDMIEASILQKVS